MDKKLGSTRIPAGDFDQLPLRQHLVMEEAKNVAVLNFFISIFKTHGENFCMKKSELKQILCDNDGFVRESAYWIPHEEHNPKLIDEVYELFIMEEGDMVKLNILGDELESEEPRHKTITLVEKIGRKLFTVLKKN